MGQQAACYDKNSSITEGRHQHRNKCNSSKNKMQSGVQHRGSIRV